jgi:hypothetical protein
MRGAILCRVLSKSIEIMKSVVEKLVTLPSQSLLLLRRFSLKSRSLEKNY